MGGFIGGMVAGVIVVLILGAMLSLNAPLSGKPELTTTAPSVAEAEPAGPVAEIAEVAPEADLVEQAPSALADADVETDTLTDLEGLGAEPDASPTIGDQAKGLDSPAVADTSPVKVMTEAPVAPAAPVPVPELPQQRAEPVMVDTTAPELAQPQPEEDVAAVEPEPAVPAEPEKLPEPLPAPETNSVPTDSEELPEDAAPDEDITEEDALKDNPIAVEGDEDTLPRERPRIAALPQIGGAQPDTGTTLAGKRVVPLTDRDDEVAEGATESEERQLTGEPIKDYAASFENADSKPMMSIILIDDEGAFGAEALKDFPYPLSFAINPSDPEAAQKMARHREAGFEVLALADLPKAASAQDAEVSLSVWLETLPETVGILEGVDTGIQGNRKLADQVAEIAGGTGRGLITQDNGLNTVQKLAARNGVPSGVVFRDFDGARQDPKVMRRFLDQAAFRAGQDGAVVMLGRLRPETISALLLWGLEDRGNRVAMAPISAVMISNTQ